MTKQTRGRLILGGLALGIVALAARAGGAAGGCPGCGTNAVGGLLGYGSRSGSDFDARLQLSAAAQTPAPGGAAWPAWMSSNDARLRVVGARPSVFDRPLGFYGG